MSGCFEPTVFAWFGPPHRFSVHFNMSPLGRMKSSSIILSGLSLALWISLGSSLLFAAQRGVSGGNEIQADPYPVPTDYSFLESNKSTLLKWPRGSLIYPEINQPEKRDEVLLVDETFASPEEIQSLHRYYGSQLFRRKKYDEARKEYLKVLERDPNISIIHKHLGVIYMKSKDYKKAEAAYRMALSLDPGYTTGIAKLGLCLAAQKKYSLAEQKFKQAIKADPSNANYHLDLGHFYYYLKKNYRGALYSYKKALKLNPRLKSAKLNLKDIQKRFRKWEEQESDFKNSWGPDFDFDGSKNTGRLDDQQRPPEEAHISGAPDKHNTQHPLF